MRTLTLLTALLAVTGARAADPNSFIVRSAASPEAGVTADSLASIFGEKLATMTAVAGAPPWPYSLGDMPVVYVRDSAGQSFMASLLFVSQSQMNIWIPAGVASGPGTIAFPVTGLPPGAGTAALRIEPVTIQTVAPALFSADGSGSGVAAASGVRQVIGTTMQYPVQVFQCDQPAMCVAVPIDPGVDAPVYLTFYGTGIRGGGPKATVSVTIGGVSVQPMYAGPQPQFPGLDQINVPLSINLRGRGLVDVTVTVNGATSNAVQIAVQ